MTTDIVNAQRYLAAGCLFVAVGIDTSLLVSGAKDLVRQFKSMS